MPKTVKLGNKYRGLGTFLDLKKAFDDAQRQKAWEKEKLLFASKKQSDAATVAHQRSMELNYPGRGKTTPQDFMTGTAQVPYTGKERAVLSDVAGEGMISTAPNQSPLSKMGRFFSGASTPPGYSNNAKISAKKHLAEGKTVETPAKIQAPEGFVAVQDDKSSKGYKFVKDPTYADAAAQTSMMKTIFDMAMSEKKDKRDMIATQISLEKLGISKEDSASLIASRKLKSMLDTGKFDQDQKEFVFEQSKEYFKQRGKDVDRLIKMDLAFDDSGAEEAVGMWLDAQTAMHSIEANVVPEPGYRMLDQTGYADVISPLTQGVKLFQRRRKKTFSPRPKFRKILNQFEEMSVEARRSVALEEVQDMIRRNRSKKEISAAEEEIMLDRASELYVPRDLYGGNNGV